MAAHDALEVARLCHSFISCSKNNIHTLEFSAVGRTVTSNLQHFHTELLREVEAFLYGRSNFYTHPTNSHRDSLGFCLTFPGNFGYSRFHGIQWHRETQTLCHGHHRCGDTHNTPNAIDKRP